MRQRAREAAEELHVRIPEVGGTPVGQMSGGQRQGVAIARTVSWGRRALILDEPTAALGVQESEAVMHLIERLRERETPMLIVSHNLPMVFRLCTRIVVLRLGHKVGDLAASATSPDEIVALSDGRFGFRMVHPTRGVREPVFEFEQVRDAERDQERAERLRLYYVAMTRAIDRLIVSGAIDAGRAADRETPIGWVIDRLGASEEVLSAGSEPVEIDRGDARFVLVVARAADEVGAVEEPAGDEPSQAQLLLFDELPSAQRELGLELPPLDDVPVPPTHDVRRLSYSALALFERCSYRYFAERVLGLRPESRGDRSKPEGAGLAATELGDAVHRLLEAIPLSEPVPPARDELDATVCGWYAAVTADELDRIDRLVRAYCASDLARRLAELPGARPERPFTFEQDGVLLHGRLDVLWRDGARALVVDYKSNALEGTAPADIVEEDYRLQRLVYALASLRDGAEEVEVVYQFLEQPEVVVSARFASSDVPALESELSAAIDRIRAGVFRPTPSDFACGDCPALDLLCAGPRLAVAG